VVLASHSTFKREAGYPGGAFGHAADRYTIFAQGQSQRVNRYLVTLALLLPLIVITADTPTEAKVSAERINQMYSRLDALKIASDTCARSAKSQTRIANDQTMEKPVLDMFNCDVTDFKVDSKTGLANVRTSFGFETAGHEVARSP